MLIINHAYEPMGIKYTDNHLNKVIYGEKNLVPDCNTLAYRKDKQITTIVSG